MNKLIKYFGALLCVFALVVSIAGCNPTGKNSASDSTTSSGEGDPQIDVVDYVAQLHLDLNSTTKKQEVTVKTYIDGDTTHFDPVTSSTLTGYNAADFANTWGYIKARYIAVNTPESTGDVEKWGKTASNFTHDKLASASSIIVESDDNTWNIDSTGERYTVWVWYKPSGETEYRNLNIELLQNGYGYAQNTETNRYGTKYAMPALMQAKALKLKCYSKDVDPNFYEGDAFNITLKKLRCNLNDYVQKTVRVEGVVTTQMDNNVYIEDYDEETGLCFGISVFYGYNPGAPLRKVLTIGNRVSVCGTVTYSDDFGAQISGISNNAFHPEYTTNTVNVLDENGDPITGQQPHFAKAPAEEFISGTLNIKFTNTIEDEDGNIVEQEYEVPINYGEAILSTTVSFDKLYVDSAYTTQKGESTGAISLTCKALNPDGTLMNKTFVVRTTVLKHPDGQLLTQDELVHKYISVKGIVDKYDGAYQVKVHLIDFIEILD